jgi:peptidoglycan/LPS O-acetylase OafA/YrhL
MIATFVVALALLGCWAYAVWHYDWLPPFAVLVATIVWRFVIDAKSLNDLGEQARIRRIAVFLALALLGLGMLVLSHGSQGGVLDGASVSDVTDRIAVAVIAPIWLVHYAVRSIATQG